MKEGETGKGDILEKWGPGITRLVLEVLLPFVVAWWFSHILQSWTDSVLWLPKDWRIAVEFLVTFGAAIVVSILSRASEGSHPAKRVPDGTVSPLPGIKPKVLPKHSRVQGVAAFVFVVGASVCCWNVYDLREECIRPLNLPSSWWQQQFGADPGSKSNSVARVEDLKVPSFLNPERNTMFLPDRFDKEMRGYLLAVGGSDLRAGVRLVLDREPMKLIDWADGSGKDIRRNYAAQFLLWHFGFIYSLAAAWGLFTRRVEFALENMLGRL